jgi:hypothetical protein
MRSVERQAKSGEVIKIVKAYHLAEHRSNPEYINGDILRVDRVYGCETHVKGIGEYLQTSEYVVLVNFDYSVFPKNEPWRKAKVGDKIKVVKVNRDHRPDVNVGSIQTVRNVYDDTVHGEHNSFHDSDQEYIIIEEAPETPTPEVTPVINMGDTVKVIHSGNTYSCYEKFIRKYANGFISKFKNGYSPNNGDIGVVVGSGEHEWGSKCFAVLSNDKVFCIGEKGIIRTVTPDFQ